MDEQAVNKALITFPFFRGLLDTEIHHIAQICKSHAYSTGEICQNEGQSVDLVHFIVHGRAGAIVHIPNINYLNNEIILDTLGPGDVFGWSSLIRGTTWSTLRVLEPTEVLSLKSEEVIKLCEENYHVGYVIMKNLAALIASRLRRNRMSVLNALVAIKGV